MSRFEEVDVDQVEPKKDLGKLKVRKGEKQRVGFPLINSETGKVRIIPVPHYKYNQNLKLGFLVPANKELAKRCEAVMGAPQVRYVTPVVVYRMADSKGNVQKPLEWDVVPFVMSDDKLATIQGINLEFPISEVDLFLTCGPSDQDEKFQNLVFAPTKQAFWAVDEGLKKKVMEAADTVAKTMHEAVSFDLSEEKIVEKLFGGGGTKPAVQSGSAQATAGSIQPEGEEENLEDLLG